MSTTIVSVIVMLLATFLPKFGITLGNDELTTTVTSLLVLGSGLWIWIRRYQAGDIHWSGVRT